jgi:hypothetical protein
LKIRCIKKDPWLTIGKEYLVLGVYGRGNSFKYRILADDGRTPALHDSDLFELVSAKIPREWVFHVYPPSEWEISPAVLAEEGFWVAYFDGDATARADFDQVVLALLRQEQA